MDTEHDDASFACPHCGDPMTVGEIGVGSRGAFSLSWRDIVAGEAGTPGTLYVSETEGSLVRPGLICRACESIFIDFSTSSPQQPEAVRRTFDERVRDMHGDVNMEALATVLREGDPRQCSKAVETFVEIGADAIPVLEQLCEDDDPDVRVDAAKALERIKAGR